MSGGSQEVDSCITEEISDISGELDNYPLPSRSSSLLSGYDADLESGGEDSDFASDAVSNGSVNGPIEMIQETGLAVGNKEPLQVDVVIRVCEEVADSEEEFTTGNVQVKKEGDESSSSRATSKSIEEKSLDDVTNLRRKRTEDNAIEIQEGKKRML